MTGTPRNRRGVIGEGMGTVSVSVRHARFSVLSRKTVNHLFYKSLIYMPMFAGTTRAIYPVSRTFSRALRSPFPWRPAEMAKPRDDSSIPFRSPAGGPVRGPRGPSRLFRTFCRARRSDFLFRSLADPGGRTGAPSEAGPQPAVLASDGGYGVRPDLVLQLPEPEPRPGAFDAQDGKPQGNHQQARTGCDEHDDAEQEDRAADDSDDDATGDAVADASQADEHVMAIPEE